MEENIVLVHAVSIEDVLVESIEIEDGREANVKEHVVSGHKTEFRAI